MIDDGVRLRSATPRPTVRSQAFAAESTKVSTLGRRIATPILGSGGIRQRKRRKVEQELGESFGAFDLRTVATFVEQFESRPGHRVEHALRALRHDHPVLLAPYDQ